MHKNFLLYTINAFKFVHIFINTWPYILLYLWMKVYLTPKKENKGFSQYFCQTKPHPFQIRVARCPHLISNLYGSVCFSHLIENHHHLYYKHDSLLMFGLSSVFVQNKHHTLPQSIAIIIIIIKAAHRCECTFYAFCSRFAIRCDFVHPYRMRCCAAVSLHHFVYKLN